LRQSRRRRARGTPRVAYVLWRYPTLSETFIRREVEALRQAGLSLEVFALKPEDSPAVVDHVIPADHTTYFGPDPSPAGRAFVFRCLRRRPLTVILLYLYVVRLRAGTGSTWWRDRDVFYLGGQLAAALAEAGVTHVHSPWAGPYAVIGFVASRLIGVTFSVQARASEIHRTTAATGLPDRLRFAEFIVTNSRYNERFLRDVLGPASPPVRVIYNGLDLHRFPGVFRQRGIRGSLRVLAVGRLVEPKGFKHLLQACRLLVDRGVDVTCDIIGGADPSDTVTWLELRMLQVALGLESRVRLLGAQRFTAVLEAFERADVFALPCVRARDGSHDITPNALIEAMAMQLPVVSTTSGAIPEIVDHEVNGLLVEPGDVVALADALERLLNDGELRRSLGDSARRKVEDQFDVGRNVAPRLELFRSSGTQQS
jgi:glycosyltransferase involved in cell wall biosynthesis